jgi:15-cis-phytoene synthase
MTNLFTYPYYLIRPLYEKTSFHKGVITDIPDIKLQKAYSHCREITRHHAKTFYMATRFLPREKQRSIFAIYGICRYLDDLVDEAMDLMKMENISIEDIRLKLNLFRENLLNTYSGLAQEDPILIAFSDVLRKYHISVSLPLELMQGVMMDLEKKRYDNFDELYAYSFKVASIVGLMTSEVFGYKNKMALQHAIDLGIAMQLTNILRDIGEDLRKDRIYLPKDELELFGITEQQLFEAHIDDNFVKFMRFQVTRARRYYQSAGKGIQMLDQDSRLPVYLAKENYSRILDKIEESNYQVFNNRAYLNTREKLTVIPGIFYKIHTAD